MTRPTAAQVHDLVTRIHEAVREHGGATALPADVQSRYRELVALEAQGRAEGLGVLPAPVLWALWTLGTGLAVYLGVSVAPRVARGAQRVVDTWTTVAEWFGWALLAVGAYRVAVGGMGGLFTRRGPGEPMWPRRGGADAMEWEE